MKITSIIPLVNWGMGAILIGVFAVVCVVMVLVIYNMANSDKKDTTDTEAE
jgi:ABC-type transport system involved in cytochrome bd biosynthesis fused ATPase/permease subunit